MKGKSIYIKTWTHCEVKKWDLVKFIVVNMPHIRDKMLRRSY